MHELVSYITMHILIHIPDKPQPPPKRYGMLLFPAFQALDVFGPLDALNILSREFELHLAMIAVTLGPVSTRARSSSMNPKNSAIASGGHGNHTAVYPAHRQMRQILRNRYSSFFLSINPWTKHYGGLLSLG